MPLCDSCWYYCIDCECLDFVSDEDAAEPGSTKSTERVVKVFPLPEAAALDSLRIPKGEISSEKWNNPYGESSPTAFVHGSPELLSSSVVKVVPVRATKENMGAVDTSSFCAADKLKSSPNSSFTFPTHAAQLPPPLILDDPADMNILRPATGKIDMLTVQGISPNSITSEEELKELEDRTIASQCSQLNLSC